MSRTEQMKFPFLVDEDMQLEIGIPEMEKVSSGYEEEMGMEANDWRDKDSDSRVRKYIRQFMKDGIETEEDANDFFEYNIRNSGLGFSDQDGDGIESILAEEGEASLVDELYNYRF
jgi:hypothetical protein